MKIEEVVSRIEEIGIVPVVRAASVEEANRAAEAISAGGIPVVEITMTVPGAMDVIAHLVKHHPKLIVGAGTVLDVETARQCADAGAHFLTAPGFDCDIVAFAAEHDMVSMPGALSSPFVHNKTAASNNF